MIGGKTLKRIARNFSHPKNNSGVPHGVIGREQPRANRSDFATLHMFCHDCEPIAINDFNVAVQEKQPRTGRLFDGKIIERGKIGWSAEMEDTMRRVRKIGARVVREHCRYQR